MDRKIGKFFHSIGDFFSRGGEEEMPWQDVDLVAGCEIRVADAEEKDSSDERKRYCMRYLIWSLVLSRRREDVGRGIAMLEADPDGKNSSITPSSRVYLLAVGYFRNGDFSKSRQFIEGYLERHPRAREALTVKKAIEDRGVKGGEISIGIAVTAVGFVGALLFSRKK